MEEFDPAQWLASSKAALEEHKSHADSAAQRKGQKRTIARRDLSATFEQALPSDDDQIRHTVLGYPYPPCLAPLADLTPISIADFTLETVHRGTVLTVRTFDEAQHNWAIQNAVEDGKGGVALLSIYSFDLDMTANKLLPKGTSFAIKEPYYKLAMNGQATIMVMHPSDIVKVADTDFSPENALEQLSIREKSLVELKNQGNEAFKAKDYHRAAEVYTEAFQVHAKLESTTEEELVATYDILRNRALVNIRLGRFEKALADARASVMPSHVPLDGTARDQLNIKAYFRAGCAAYQLQEYVSAMGSFRQVLELKPQDADAQPELQRSIDRLAEQQTGIYDLIAMTESALLDPDLDHASYTSLVVAQATKDRGRGLFAKKDIKAGELVLCEKAFAIGFKTDTPQDYNMLLNINTGSTSTGPNVERLCHAVTTLQHNPQLAREFSHLYDGGYQPATLGQVDGVYDVFQVEAALQYNGFCCPVKPTSVEYEAYDEYSSAGVWLVAAAMNHDCIGNVNSSFIGDMMVVRASKDVAAGEEILLRYHMGDDFEQFQEEMQTSWKFTCTCRLCKVEGKISAKQHKRRSEAYDRARVLMSINPIAPGREMPPKLVKEAERLYDTIASTYDNRYGTLPRKCLFELSHWISQTYTFDPPKGRSWAENTLRSVGVELDVGEVVKVNNANAIPSATGVAAMVYIALTYKMEQRFEIAEQIQAFGEEMYKILNGSTFGFREKHT